MYNVCILDISYNGVYEYQNQNGGGAKLDTSILGVLMILGWNLALRRVCIYVVWW